MTLEAITPLITATAQLVMQLVNQINNSLSMNAEEKQRALADLSMQLGQTAAKVANVRLEGTEEA